LLTLCATCVSRMIGERSPMWSSWWIWPIGAILLFAAGAVTALVPRRRAAGLRRRTAWSAARAAIDTAAISRDAAPVDVPEAEPLLARAESVAAGHGGARAADAAAAFAERADRLWRAAADA
jgi:hypothetical protein